jgi:hypothetical protein
MAVVEGVGKPEGCKLIRVRAEIQSGIIRSISICGDFFASPEEGFDRAVQRLSGIALSDVGAAFTAALTAENVEASGITGEGVAAVVTQRQNE